LLTPTSVHWVNFSVSFFHLNDVQVQSIYIYIYNSVVSVGWLFHTAMYDIFSFPCILGVSVNFIFITSWCGEECDIIFATSWYNVLINILDFILIYKEEFIVVNSTTIRSRPGHEMSVRSLESKSCLTFYFQMVF